jgi:hypothetical protein
MLKVIVDGVRSDQPGRVQPNVALQVSPLALSEWPPEATQLRHEEIVTDGPMTSVTQLDPPVPAWDLPVNIYVFGAPIIGYQDVEDVISQLDRATVSMKPDSLLAHGQELSLQLEQPNYYYDVAETAQHLGRERALMIFGRFSTGAHESYSSTMTLDLMKVLAAERLGLTVEQLADINARVIPMTAWGNGGRLVIAGFELAANPHHERCTVAVNHMGGVDVFPLREKAEV